MLASYLRCPPAWFYNRILVGAGNFLSLRFAAEHNITHVINCAQPYDSPDWFRAHFPKNYVCLNAIDNTHVNILDWFPVFEETLQRFLREGEGNVYVHCQAGINRSGFLALAYVCKHFQLPIDEVILAVRKQRPVLFQNPVFMNQVKEFINNGCVSREKNSGHTFIGNDNGNAGLSPSGDCSRVEGDQDNSRESQGGKGQTM